MSAPLPWRRSLLVGGAFLLLVAPWIRLSWKSANVWSRLMAIECLAGRGSLVADRSPLLGQSFPDVVWDGRHFYTDKPPVLLALGAVVDRAFGLRLDGPTRGENRRSIEAAAATASGIAHPGGMIGAAAMARWVSLAGWVGDLTHAHFVLDLILVALPCALAVVGVRALLGRVPLRAWVADALALGLGFGSLSLVYALTFNNHAPAAGLVTLALALVVGEGEGRHRGRRFAVGTLLGLAATIDLPAGGAAAGVVGVWLLIRRRNLPLFFALGLIGPLVAHAVLQSEVTGTPLPVEMYPRMFEYKGSYWATEAGRWKESGPRWQFGLELLVGPQGWLTVTPALMLGLIGLGTTLVARGRPLRALAWATATLVLVLVPYYVWGVRRTDFAGQSYGTRHLLALTPVVSVFAVDLCARARRWWLWALLGATMAIGLGYALEGVRDPWSRIDRRDEPMLQALGRLTLYPFSSYPR